MAAAGKLVSRFGSVVHVLSQFPGLGNLLETNLPKGISVKVVKLSETRFNMNLMLNPEEKEEVKSAEILLADNTLLAQVLYDLPHLRWAQGTWTGVDSIVSKLDCTKPKPSFLLSRLSSDEYSAQMAEYVLAQIINNERLFYSFWDLQKAKIWDTSTFDFRDVRIIGDLTVGILGGGVFASAIAKLLKSCSARVISLVRTPRETLVKPAEFDQMVTDLPYLLQESDYICNTLPGTPSTTGMLNGDVLKQCLKSPIFINLGRGNIINEEDLVNSLRKKWISGAILDVFEAEPLPPESPLWSMPKVVITPHVGANTHMKHVLKCFLENYELLQSGHSPRYLIDWHRGY